MTLNLYSAYKTWRREVAAGRLEAAARRVIEPSIAGKRRNRPAIDMSDADDASIGIG